MNSYVLQPFSYYRPKFRGSLALKRACWRQYLNGAIDDPTCDQDVMDWLENIASERVNNPKSRFYIYG